MTTQSPCRVRLPTGGIGLLEVLVVLGIVGILAAIATPGFKDAADRNAVEAEVSLLVGAVQSARAHAIRTRTTTTLTLAACSATSWAGWSVNSGGTAVETYQHTGRVACNSAGSTLTLAHSGLPTAAAWQVTLSRGVHQRTVRVEADGIPRVS